MARLYLNDVPPRTAGSRTWPDVGTRALGQHHVNPHATQPRHITLRLPSQSCPPARRAHRRCRSRTRSTLAVACVDGPLETHRSNSAQGSASASRQRRSSSRSRSRRRPAGKSETPTTGTGARARTQRAARWRRGEDATRGRHRPHPVTSARAMSDNAQPSKIRFKVRNMACCDMRTCSLLPSQSPSAAAGTNKASALSR